MGNPLNLTTEDAEQILKELVAFRGTKLFDYLQRSFRETLLANMRAILDEVPKNQTQYNEREALLGESRLLDNFIYKISGEVQETMEALLIPVETEETEENEP